MKLQKQFHAFVWRMSAISLLFGAFLMGGSIPVQAQGYEGLIVTQSGSGTLTMAPGEVKEVSVSILNRSDQTWLNDGTGYLSVYTYEPKYRRSDFDPGTWLSPEQVKRIREAVVAPGETASVIFELHAPEQEGDYTETFRFASEDQAWIDGGEFSFVINVTDEERGLPVSDGLASEETGEQELSAELTVRSANQIKAQAGRPILFTAGFKNTGDTIWTSYGLQEADVSLASTRVSFAHPSWSGSNLVSQSGTSIAPGEMAIVSFAFSAPEYNGSHEARFQFTANGEIVDDALVEIPVDVTDGSEEIARAVDEADSEEDARTQEGIAVAKNMDEPMLRVGVLIVDEETDNKVVITSLESNFTVRDTEGNMIAELEAGQEVTAYYDDLRYYFDVGRGLEVSTYGLRFIPEDENAVMDIVNFDARETRGSSHAYNSFRNILEFRYTEYKDRAWVINELPIEQYLYGLAETSNSSHEEYQKSLVTAARTYAFYHYTYGTKRAKEYMHVVSWSDDQVYRGYDREAQSPRIVQAVDDTRGVIVTYDIDEDGENDIAITPYFSRSDGQTRNWSDVWWGDKPWAQSVSVPCDEGKTLWGHGVGLSASGALCMANEGELWEDILSHFYTDITLERWWE